MNRFNEQLIGKHIATGGEHKVYHYGEHQVIKFPYGPRYFFDREQHCENVQRDEDVAKKYFEKYLIKREIKFFEKNGRPYYAIIEPFIAGRHLRRSDLSNPAIKKQFEEIVVINRDMAEKEDLMFDMFGIWGLLWHGKKEVANIMLEEGTKRLVVVDPSVMHFGRHKDQQVLVSGVTSWARRKQRKLLNYYLTT